MYHIQLTDKIPAPKPATVDRIVAVHYYAAWKKGAPGIHNGFDDLHDFPDRTPLWGYYDEGNPTVTDFEIKWAVEHGINCFIHCWYRKKDNMGKPVTVNDLRCGHGLHEALFHASFQNAVKFAIMFEASPRWGGTDERDMVENLMPFWTEQYFKRGNYLLIDNKPVLFVYSQYRLAKECFPDAAAQKRTFDACREYAVKQGFDGMIIAANVYGDADKAVYDEHIARGYDFVFGYNAGYSPENNYPSEEEIIEGQCGLYEKRLSFAPNGFIPTASCLSDATPRTTKAWMDLGYRLDLSKIWNLTTEGYRKVLRRMKETSDKLPDGAWGKRIMMIDNWNEWDEGHFVAPSHAFGFGYLQAIREELTARDNLPDYRTPEDLGFTDFNHTWGEPDLSEASARYREKQKTR
ncbi:MAG: glycoside hydrolase family 99-like domain-containing protein [Clostridia bacterium]|nr:glycoside hydrolase family 99-like domain-containing protein [Clostridia bacterium]